MANKKGQLSKLRCGFGRTINLGNYETARFYVEAEYDLDQGEDPIDAKADLLAETLKFARAAERVSKRLG